MIDLSGSGMVFGDFDVVMYLVILCLTLRISDTIMSACMWLKSPIATLLPPSCCANPTVKMAKSRTARSPTFPPGLFLYDVTSTYLEGEHNALGEFGYNRDGKKGKLQIVIGLLTDPSGEPLAVRAFRGNTADPKTVATQIEILTKQFAVQDVVFVGDRGMVKSTGKQN